MGDASVALRRIDAALARIENAAAARPAPAPSGEAEQLRATLHGTLAQLDQLIAEMERPGA